LSEQRSSFTVIPDSYANGWRLECALCALAPMVLSLVLLSLPESPLWLSLHARQNGYEHIGGIQSSHPAVNEQTGCGACLLLQGNSKKALHLLVPLLVLYQLSGFGWLMSDMKSVLSDETGLFSVAVGGAHAAGSILSLTLIPKFKRRTILVHASTAYIVVLLLVATAFSSDNWAARSVVTGFRACGVVLAIGIFQAGVAPMFWGELLRARLFVAKPYSLFVQCSSQRFSNHELEVLAYAWLSSVAQFWPQ
jgi:hypothetical protein